MLCGDLMSPTMSPTFFFSIICIYIFNLTFYSTLNNKKKTIKINNNKIIK